MDIEFDLESSPLQLRTKSTPEIIKVFFFDSKIHDAGGVFINCTSSPPKYELRGCRDEISITTTLPTDKDRTWQITKTTEPLRITIQCDEVVVVSFTEETCTTTRQDWLESLSRDVKTIRFDKNPSHGVDDTEFYRAGARLDFKVLKV